MAKALPIPSIEDAHRHPIAFAFNSARSRDWLREWLTWHGNNAGKLGAFVTENELDTLFYESRETSGLNTPRYKSMMKMMKEQSGGMDAYYAFTHATMRIYASLLAFEKEFREKHLKYIDRRILKGMTSLDEAMRKSLKKVKRAAKQPMMFSNMRDGYDLIFCYLLRLKNDFESQEGQPMRPEEFTQAARLFYPHVVDEAASNHFDNIALEQWFQKEPNVFIFRRDDEGHLALDVRYPSKARMVELLREFNEKAPPIELSIQEKRLAAPGHFGCPALQAGVTHQINPMHVAYWTTCQALRMGFWPETAPEAFNHAVAFSRALITRADMWNGDQVPPPGNLNHMLGIAADAEKKQGGRMLSRPVSNYVPTGTAAANSLGD
jgi:hypothetical protein